MHPGNTVFAGQASTSQTSALPKGVTIDFTLPAGMPLERAQALLQKMGALATAVNTAMTVEPDNADDLPVAAQAALTKRGNPLWD